MRFALLLLVASCADDYDAFCDDNMYPVDETRQEFDQGDLSCIAIHTTAECRNNDDCICSPTETSMPAACVGECFGATEAECRADPNCFETGDARAFFIGQASFVACYPNQASTTQQLPPCSQRFTAATCEQFTPRSNEPTCEPLFLNGGFFACVDTTAVADPCAATVTCPDAAPSCGPGTVPAIVDGCYSGSCIPQAWCP
ncbi:MAG: hypothetical protein QM831_14475 [Kofleriaceae bacterium]